jgi:hypothetical protein
MAKSIKPVGTIKETPLRKPTEEETTINLGPKENVEEETSEPVSCAAQGIPDSPMLNAFMDQSGIDYNDDEQRFDGSEAEESKKSQSANKEAQDELMLYMASRSPKRSSISDTVDYPTRVSKGDLDDVTEPHSNLKGYDHSLEEVRDWENLPKDEDPPKGFTLGIR